MLMFVHWIIIMFIGEHIAKLDDKGRLVFPAQLKTLVDSAVAGKLRFVLKKNLFALCLEMYPQEVWNQLSKDTRARLNFFNPEHQAIWREYTSDTALVEPDEKMGRILIPKRLLEMIDVRKEVVFKGSDHLIEVWAKEHYEKAKLPKAEYLSLIQKILG